ncbi:hypothetical protein B0H13DRAFT_1854666 [Mycena leptocephala]|nr:hypothetical protein B0H13DRAFT_1854666 [Mycena leptocephala]
MSLNSDGEDGALALSPESSSQPAAAPGRRRAAATLATSTVDAQGYLWIDEKELVVLQQDKSADCKYFFGSLSHASGQVVVFLEALNLSCNTARRLHDGAFGRLLLFEFVPQGINLMAGT